MAWSFPHRHAPRPAKTRSYGAGPRSWPPTLAGSSATSEWFSISTYRKRRLLPLLLSAGATIPSDTTDAYLRKVRAVGFPAYEKAHRMRLTATFAAKFPRLPVEMVSKVVAFAFHTGYY